MQKTKLLAEYWAIVFEMETGRQGDISLYKKRFVLMKNDLSKSV